ncbi:hypothetical protein [Rhizobium oryziradicis]|uniref:Uncharacterized protein n=1 Tax=Rhizobium oryziradicis TaxID=1867956 RepID=A0A1Q8ZRM8_9HYPH|nr:hypothetical protein [Rhizobium oryziradicis]OLP44610.1 hypothetical protein BJF95_08890 [Rhizobium oryziradicis]
MKTPSLEQVTQALDSVYNAYSMLDVAVFTVAQISESAPCPKREGAIGGLERFLGAIREQLSYVAELLDEMECSETPKRHVAKGVAHQ